MKGHQRAQKLYPDLGGCERCPAPATERHHKNGDPDDNAPGNVERLCRRCHMTVDGRIAALIDAGDQPKATAVRAAQMRALTTCALGHPLDYVKPNGRRGCSTCRLEAGRRWRARRKA